MNIYLVMGLGSMGKRRIRCLLALGINKNNIIGFDLRKDRRNEAKEKYGIIVAEALENIDADSLSAVIVSLPPDKHFIGAKYAIDNKKPVFIEASVVLEDAIKIRDYNNGQFLIAPSNTFTHHPILKKVIEVVKSGAYGSVTNFCYNRGDYLPEWHTYENVNDFYVSNRVTGGAREIMPFEMTWIVDAFGFPKEVKGYFRKTKCDIGCSVEDSYVSALDYGNFIGLLSVNVSSRYVVQDLIINMTEGQIRWRWDENKLCLFDAKTKEWDYYVPDNKTIHESGYLDFINENMYIEEMESFLKAVSGKEEFNNNINKDIKVLQVLTQLEDSDGGFNREEN